MNVRLSVVTICLNPGEALQRTVESIAALAGSMEWIVVDGGSTDGTQERLRALSRPPDRLLSERDSGIANAFNKGIALATGDAICFMNAGDEFAGPDALTGLVDRWERGPDFESPS